MARPKKVGLDYFPLDVDIFENDKLFDVQNEYGPLGEVIYIRLLCLIYKNGYFYRFESLDKLAAMMIKSIGNRWTRDKKVVKEVILYLAKCNLFSAELMRDNVLTSRGIQARYLKAHERNLPKIEEYNLLENFQHREGLITAPENRVSVTETKVFATETAVNVCKNATKESKENEIKVEESKVPAAPSSATKNNYFFSSDTRAQLTEKYGESAVSKYEDKYRKWCSSKGISGGDMYGTIAKWMAQDNVTAKAQRSSSFDMDDIMQSIIDGYKKE